jgi:hypothetical protein
VRPGARGIAAGVVLLLVGAAAVLTAPTDEGVHGPIPVRGAVGSPVQGRMATLTVTGVRLAKTVRIPDGARFGESVPVVGTNGLWVVIDADVTMTSKRRVWTDVELRSGGITWRVESMLPGTSLVDTPYRPGVASHGSFVFEVPRSLAGHDVEFWLTPDIDTHDDTVPVVPLHLDATAAARVTIEAPTVEGQG